MADLDGTYVRVCPDCGAEFVSMVEVCHDCETALETRLADAGGAHPVDPAAAALAAAGPPATTEPPAGWVQIETADLDWALELRARLADAGVASHLARDCASCSPRLSVYVAPEDLGAAQHLAQKVYVEKVPDVATSGALGVQETDDCPACGARLPEHATSCPDCGLAFVPLDGPPG